MARLSKDDARLHRQARQLVALARDLTDEEIDFVFEHYQESQNPGHGLDGAFFTPEDLAFDLTVEVGGDRLIDLCAGIGRIASLAAHPAAPHRAGRAPSEIVCVERDPEYVRVGRKLVPQAQWIEADVLALPPGLGGFDTAFGNPPFGGLARSANPTAYTGALFEYHVIAVAARLADSGVFLIPQPSAPVRHSGLVRPVRQHNGPYGRFTRETGLKLTSSSIDTATHARAWRGVSPRVEVVVCDYASARRATQAGRRPVTAPACPAVIGR
ncbi:hypothetical protein KDK95_33225 [Actinospica sp. MGRD01-02]|uniref:Methyltransferase n=1 Tax=Actinospica acidithermotolerans TaxID=2828514 RepID=A0A941EH61_9ACTN|nr:hypothetical protein [Actinospica acidithermotolerans]MBR7831216.1 hypothetical protein [Actinospica acidithermotolerans]